MRIPMIRRILLAWIVVCSSGSLGGTELMRGPYLQNATPQSVTIRWRTDEAIESIVRYGTNLAELSDVRGNLVSTTNHGSPRRSRGSSTACAGTLDAHLRRSR